MFDLATPEDASPWHEGERAIQRSVGAEARMAATGPRVIRDHLIEQHRAFYPLLPFIVAGSVDRSGDVWATLLTGRPGFLSSPDPMTLGVAAARDRADPADAGLEDGDAIALLGIELETRRRNRLNGALRRTGPESFEVAVEESFGNCPQFISPRVFRFVRDPAGRQSAPPERLPALDERARAMIARADTMFIASYVDLDGRRRVDASHRGGRAGFVRLDGEGALVIPDFAGNRFFNTLGNIRSNPKAGVVFVDFESGDLLQLSGDAEVVLDGPEISDFEGAERLVRLTPRRIVRRLDALPLRWRPSDGGA